MSVKKVASRYAKSLLDLAVESNKLEIVKENMAGLLSLIRENREFSAFLKSPVIQFAKKRAILEQLFSGKLDELTLKFILILAGKQREAILVEVISAFLDQYRKLKHISIVKIISAAPLPEDQVNQLKHKLEASIIGFENVEVTTAVDPKLMGGYILEVEGNVYDASVRHKLENLRKEFKINLYESKIEAR
jgi:F-type H+-transporting ATPase subunit delta